MQENQNIEWKENWRDEYLKWICGFANAQGGLLVIGKDDKGFVKGLSDAKKLLEDIPNKVRDILGILVDVNLKIENNKEYLEIIIEPYQHPISYKGQYHYRTGSTKQELKGASLEQFLLKKQGRNWDSVPIPNIKISDLKNDSFQFFLKRAYQSKRLEQDSSYDNNENLIEKLNLKELKYLKRAAILLFHPNPEKYFTGSYIKIGFFENDYTLKYQDEIHGNLFEQIEKTMEILLTKYMKAYISFKGLQRLENYLFPESSLREALLNAIAHKDYNSGVPIQIKVYDDQIIFLMMVFYQKIGQ
ncbi:MAG: RNA-binding domain-containing protein [Cyanobacteriota bacterium]